MISRRREKEERIQEVQAVQREQRKVKYGFRKLLNIPCLVGERCNQGQGEIGEAEHSARR